MKTRIAQISIILSTLVVSGCFDPPEYSEIPHIEFEKLELFEGSDEERTSDSLLLTFSIQDGDGNVGINESESFVPYHSYNIIVDSNDSLVTYTGDFDPPFYSVNPAGAVELFSNEDNRPVYNCTNYLIANTSTDVRDTFYIELNEYHHNLHVDILKKRNGEYSLMDYGEAFGSSDCALNNFNGRVPVFDEENIGRSLKGSIGYAMLSAGHKIVLSRDTFMVRFYLYDRALNQSNVVETPDFTLSDVFVD